MAHLIRLVGETLETQRTFGLVQNLAIVLAAVGVFAFWQYCREQEATFREGRARDVIELVGIE